MRSASATIGAYRRIRTDRGSRSSVEYLECYAIHSGCFLTPLRSARYSFRWRLNAQRICIALIFLTQALYGIVRAASPNEALLTCALMSMTLIFFWCSFNAAARKVALPPWNQVLIIAVAIVGVPVYFFRTMSWREALLATLKAAGVLVAAGIVSAVCTLIVRA